MKSTDSLQRLSNIELSQSWSFGKTGWPQYPSQIARFKRSSAAEEGKLVGLAGIIGQRIASTSSSFDITTLEQATVFNHAYNNDKDI